MPLVSVRSDDPDAFDRLDVAHLHDDREDAAKSPGGPAPIQSQSYFDNRHHNTSRFAPNDSGGIGGGGGGGGGDDVSVMTMDTALQQIDRAAMARAALEAGEIDTSHMAAAQVLSGSGRMLREASGGSSAARSASRGRGMATMAGETTTKAAGGEGGGRERRRWSESSFDLPQHDNGPPMGNGDSLALLMVDEALADAGGAASPSPGHRDARNRGNRQQRQRSRSPPEPTTAAILRDASARGPIPVHSGRAAGGKGAGHRAASTRDGLSGGNAQGRSYSNDHRAHSERPMLASSAQSGRLHHHHHHPHHHHNHPHPHQHHPPTLEEQSHEDSVSAQDTFEGSAPSRQSRHSGRSSQKSSSMSRQSVSTALTKGLADEVGGGGGAGGSASSPGRGGSTLSTTMSNGRRRRDRVRSRSPTTSGGVAAAGPSSISSGVSGGSTAQRARYVQSLEREVDRLRSELAEARTEADALRDEVRMLQDENEELDGRAERERAEKVKWRTAAEELERRLVVGNMEMTRGRGTTTTTTAQGGGGSGKSLGSEEKGGGGGSRKNRSRARNRMARNSFTNRFEEEEEGDYGRMDGVDLDSVHTGEESKTAKNEEEQEEDEEAGAGASGSAEMAQEDGSKRGGEAKTTLLLRRATTGTSIAHGILNNIADEEINPNDSFHSQNSSSRKLGGEKLSASTMAGKKLHDENHNSMGILRRFSAAAGKSSSTIKTSSMTEEGSSGNVGGTGAGAGAVSAEAAPPPMMARFGGMLQRLGEET